MAVHFNDIKFAKVGAEAKSLTLTIWVRGWFGLGLFYWRLFFLVSRCGGFEFRLIFWLCWLKGE